MKITVGTATQYQDIDQGVTLLQVPYEILDDNDVVLMERIQSFPLETTETDIKEFLVRTMEVYKQKVASHEEAKGLQAGVDNAQAVAEQISGISITD